jgi:hypothetical protein
MNSKKKNKSDYELLVAKLQKSAISSQKLIYFYTDELLENQAKHS